MGTDPAGNGLCAKYRARNGALGTRAAPAFANAHVDCLVSALLPHDDSALVNPVLINAQFSPQADAIGTKKTQFPRSHTAVSGRRYYNPTQGRFLGRDPKGEAGGRHLYAFCGNDAVNRWDYLGMKPDGSPNGKDDVTTAVEVRDGIVYNVTYRAVLSDMDGFGDWVWDDGDGGEAVGTLGNDGSINVGGAGSGASVGIPENGGLDLSSIGTGIIIAANGAVQGVPRVRNPANSTLRISDQGLAVLGELEGFRNQVYRDQAGNLTIGFGHKLTAAEAAKYKSGITRDQAMELLRGDVSIAEASILRNVSSALTQEQFDGLGLFVYNVGSGAFANSSVLRDVNAGNLVNVAADMEQYNKVRVGGQLVVSNGLVYRRWREAWIFHGIYDPEAEGIPRPGR